MTMLYRFLKCSSIFVQTLVILFLINLYFWFNIWKIGIFYHKKLKAIFEGNMMHTLIELKGWKVNYAINFEWLSLFMKARFLLQIIFFNSDNYFKIISGFYLRVSSHYVRHIKRTKAVLTLFNRCYCFDYDAILSATILYLKYIIITFLNCFNFLCSCFSKENNFLHKKLSTSK